MTKEEILKKCLEEEYPTRDLNSDIAIIVRGGVIKAAIKAMEQYANQRALEIAGEAYDTGASHEYNAHFGKVPNPTPDKETYLSQLKTKLSQP